MHAQMIDFLSQIMSMFKHLCFLKIRIFGSCCKKDPPGRSKQCIVMIAAEGQRSSEIRISGDPDFRKSGFPDTWIFGNPGFRRLRFPEIRVSGCPDSGNPGFRCPDFWKSRYPGTRSSGNPGIRTSGCPDVRYT